MGIIEEEEEVEGLNGRVELIALQVFLNYMMFMQE